MFQENSDLYEPRGYITPGIEAVEETVRNKMGSSDQPVKLLGSRSAEKTRNRRNGGFCAVLRPYPETIMMMATA